MQGDTHRSSEHYRTAHRVLHELRCACWATAGVDTEAGLVVSWSLDSLRCGGRMGCGGNIYSPRCPGLEGAGVRLSRLSVRPRCLGCYAHNVWCVQGRCHPCINFRPTESMHGSLTRQVALSPWAHPGAIGGVAEAIRGRKRSTVMGCTGKLAGWWAERERAKTQGCAA